MTIYDINNNMIAQSKDLTYTPDPGQILPENVSLEVVRGRPDIGKIVDMKLTFTPKHKLPADTIVEINFPKMIKATCTIIDRSSSLNRYSTCSEPNGSNNMIRIGGGGRNNFFDLDRNYPGGQPIYFTFKDITLPPVE